MTPRQFLDHFRYDQRLVTGAYYPSEPLHIEQGDRIGVVMLNLGGPNKRDDVAPFLYNLFMDPAIIDLPLGKSIRHWLCRLISSKRAVSVAKDYDVIGGGSPINRLTREQAKTVESLLNEKYGKPSGVQFKTYIAMRYWHPFSEEAARQMRDDGVTKVVLLPLYPQYSKTTTGASLVYWWNLEKTGEIPTWPTTYVFEYAANPKYILAVSERIDEALQRFPRGVRDSVQLLFSPHGTPAKEMRERRDPYCCLIHSTVDRVMKHRGYDRPFHVSFQSKVGPAEWLTPSTPDKIKELAQDGHRAILVIPIAFVTDHVETAFELDVEVRQEAEELGIENFEVTSGLNCHPLFIEALADATVSQLYLPSSGAEGDGVSLGIGASLRPIDDLPKFDSSERSARCHQCQQIAEARRWDGSYETTCRHPSPSRGN